MKKLLLQIQPGPRTKQFVTDHTQREMIRLAVLGVIMDTTTGEIPAVHVTPEECACEMCSVQTGQPG